MRNLRSTGESLARRIAEPATARVNSAAAAGVVAHSHGTVGAMDTTPPNDAPTRVRRHPERGAYDRATIAAILDEAFVCHLGFVHDGRPFVIPTIHARSGDVLYLHGSPASRMLRTLADGVDVCVTVTLLDGLVLARSVYNHSMNYRSAVVFGRAREVTDRDEKLAALCDDRRAHRPRPVGRRTRAERQGARRHARPGARARRGVGEDPPGTAVGLRRGSGPAGAGAEDRRRCASCSIRRSLTRASRPKVDLPDYLARSER